MNIKYARLFAAIAVCFFITGCGGYPDKRIITTFPPGDGKIVLYNYQLGEVIDATYRINDRYDKNALAAIEDIFRSRTDGKEHKIDLELVELLDNIQDHFQADNIELISGYRSPALNKLLKGEGVAVSEESRHMQGKAADIHIDEVTEEIVVDYARQLKVGGVGYYPAWDFVHIDTGAVRSWDLPDEPGRKLVAFRKGTDWQIITDKNIYLPGESISFEITNITGQKKPLTVEPMLEMFRRGEWMPIMKFEVPVKTTIGGGTAWTGHWKPKEDDQFGKFRIVIAGPQNLPHLSVLSNEFYRKKM